ncbi:MAG: GNAT family N-acetyltransferase, partial [Dehalococcoidia bacterium]
MAIEIRPVTEDDANSAHFILAYSFTADRSTEGRERMQHLESMGPLYALYDDGEMAACLRILPLRMFIHGASIPLGGVSGVACLPEHRRKGYVGQLLRHALALMREQGQPLSALYTPHPSLYRRYGWMIASSELRYSFKPKEIALSNPARPSGHAYRITEEEWPTIAELYRRYAAHRNGYLDRDERWWKEALFRRLYDEKRRLNDVAVWTNGEGQPTGYLAYHSTSEDPPDGPSADKITLKEFVALDSDAYTGLLRYLLAHDLTDRITCWGPPDDPLIVAVDEPGRVKREHQDGFMLRIVDLENAVGLRPPAVDAPEGAFTVHVADPSAPWNQGIWRIECSGPGVRGGRLAATRADGAADLSTDAATFAAMYNGFLRPSEATRSGLA